MRICFLNQAPKKSAAYEAAGSKRSSTAMPRPAPRSRSCFPTTTRARSSTTRSARRHLHGLHHMIETPAIVRKIFWAAENGYDAVTRPTPSTRRRRRPACGQIR